MGTGHDVIRRARQIDQSGAYYLWGGKTGRGLDCSGFTRRTVVEVGGDSRMPHGSVAQRDYARRKGLLIPVKDALGIVGAGLFRAAGGGQINHIVDTIGDGRSTYEANSKRTGVGIFSAAGRRWTNGILWPGIDYPVRDTNGGGPTVDLRVLLFGIRVAKTRTYRRGHRHPDIKFIQAKINEIQPSRRLVVDGAFGDLTHKAVVDFQRFFRLGVDGVVGRRTWDALYPGI